MRRTTAKTRKTINRSGQGHCDICSERKILVEHHLAGRDIPDAEKPWNKCNICPDDHAEVHYGRIVIEGWVMTTEGKKLLWHKVGEKGLTGMESNPYVITPRTSVSATSASDIEKVG